MGRAGQGLRRVVQGPVPVEEEDLEAGGAEPLCRVLVPGGPGDPPATGPAALGQTAGAIAEPKTEQAGRWCDTKSR
jgi:hypothetical protein